jgi:hypothetical protein
MGDPIELYNLANSDEGLKKFAEAMTEMNSQMAKAFAAFPVFETLNSIFVGLIDVMVARMHKYVENSLATSFNDRLFYIAVAKYYLEDCYEQDTNTNNIMNRQLMWTDVFDSNINQTMKEHVVDSTGEVYANAEQLYAYDEQLMNYYGVAYTKLDMNKVLDDFKSSDNLKLNRARFDSMINVNYMALKTVLNKASVEKRSCINNYIRRSFNLIVFYYDNPIKTSSELIDKRNSFKKYISTLYAEAHFVEWCVEKEIIDFTYIEEIRWNAQTFDAYKNQRLLQLGVDQTKYEYYKQQLTAQKLMRTPGVAEARPPLALGSVGLAIIDITYLSNLKKANAGLLTETVEVKHGNKLVRQYTDVADLSNKPTTATRNAMRGRRGKLFSKWSGTTGYGTKIKAKFVKMDKAINNQVNVGKLGKRGTALKFGGILFAAADLALSIIAAIDGKKFVNYMHRYTNKTYKNNTKSVIHLYDDAVSAMTIHMNVYSSKNNEGVGAPANITQYVYPKFLAGSAIFKNVVYNAVEDILWNASGMEQRLEKIGYKPYERKISRCNTLIESATSLISIVEEQNVTQQVMSWLSGIIMIGALATAPVSGGSSIGIGLGLLIALGALATAVSVCITITELSLHSSIYRQLGTKHVDGSTVIHDNTNESICFVPETTCDLRQFLIDNDYIDKFYFASHFTSIDTKIMEKLTPSSGPTILNTSGNISSTNTITETNLATVYENNTAQDALNLHLGIWINDDNDVRYLAKKTIKPNGTKEYSCVGSSSTFIYNPNAVIYREELTTTTEADDTTREEIHYKFYIQKLTVDPLTESTNLLKNNYQTAEYTIAKTGIRKVIYDGVEAVNEETHIGNNYNVAEFKYNESKDDWDFFYNNEEQTSEIHLNTNYLTVANRDYINRTFALDKKWTNIQFWIWYYNRCVNLNNFDDDANWDIVEDQQATFTGTLVENRTLFKVISVSKGVVVIGQKYVCDGKEVVLESLYDINDQGQDIYMGSWDFDDGTYIFTTPKN